jgi:hypothetical protein
MLQALLHWPESLFFFIYLCGILFCVTGVAFGFFIFFCLHLSLALLCKFVYAALRSSGFSCFSYRELRARLSRLCEALCRGLRALAKSLILP